jgi:hypothetical protein
VASPRTGPAPTGVPRTLREWLSGREPPVPAALLSHLGGEDVRVSALSSTLGAEVRAALRDARMGRGERQGAYRLLVADAYLTYACEVALTSGDPTSALLDVVRQVVEEAGEG